MGIELLSWLWANSADLLAILGGLVTVASVVTKLTPTPMDDALVAQLQRLLRRFSVPGFRDESRAVYVTTELLPLIMKKPPLGK